MKLGFFKGGHKPDYFLLSVFFILVVAGLLILTSASSELGRAQFGDSYYFIKHQILNGFLLGLIGFFIAYKLNYQTYKKFAFPLLVLSIILLILVFTPLGGVTRNTNRWIHIGPMSMQPAEVLKITFIMYIAAWLGGTKGKREKSLTEGFIPFLIVSGVIALLLILQPATSTVAILLGAALVVYFLSGAPWKYIFGIVGLGMAGFALVILVTPYRLARITTYLNKGKDTQGSGYQINQALIAIGSGQLFGVGYGQSTAKVNYLPAPIDDSIFAVAAEELGFVGVTIIIGLFGALVFRLFWLSTKMRDRFGKLMLVGFGTIIAFQSLVNMASISGVLPLTGVPLPFVSYGGTALAVFLTMAGISLNISRYTSN